MATKAAAAPPNTDHRGKKIYDLKSKEARDIMAKQKVQGYTPDFDYVERVGYLDLYIPVPEVGAMPCHPCLRSMGPSCRPSIGMSVQVEDNVCFPNQRLDLAGFCSSTVRSKLVARKGKLYFVSVAGIVW